MKIDALRDCLELMRAYLSIPDCIYADQMPSRVRLEVSGKCGSKGRKESGH